MATFSYRCTATGCPTTEGDRRFDVQFPVGTAPSRTACPACGSDAVRVYTAPRLALAARHLVAAVDRAERSRSEPDVVTSVPATGRRRRPMPTAPPNPLLRKLPRP